MLDSMREVASAMSARARAQEIIAHNLANLNTGGFRRERVSFSTLLAGAPTGGVAGESAAAQLPVDQSTVPGELTLRTRLDLAPATPAFTGKPGDVAIRGSGFLVVETEDGPRYTRDGAFAINDRGELAHRSGQPIAGEGGAIAVGRADFSITRQGVVIAGENEVGRLRIVDFAPEARFEPADSGLLKTETIPNTIPKPDLLPGHTEGANVDPLTEMVNMMNSFKLYEAAAKALRAADDSLSQLLSTTRGTLR
jgi:flagellar basal body rod protein FlgG